MGQGGQVRRPQGRVIDRTASTSPKRSIMEFPRRRFLQLTGAAALAPWAHAARADGYPSRVVKLIVGFPPGGGADLAARIVVNGLSDMWGQPGRRGNAPP